MAPSFQVETTPARTAPVALDHPRDRESSPRCPGAGGTNVAIELRLGRSLSDLIRMRAGLGQEYLVGKLRS
jgi:hypothetical protein